MPDRQRIYHPVTGEPFDIPVLQAIDLRLGKGWLSQPLDSTAEPYVTTVKYVEPAPRRVIEAGCDEACEATDDLAHEFDEEE